MVALAVIALARQLAQILGAVNVILEIDIFLGAYALGHYRFQACEVFFAYAAHYWL